MDSDVIKTPANEGAAQHSPHRKRWSTLLIPLIVLGSLLWASNWFYQRSRLFTGSHVVLGDPFLPWGLLIGDNTARELFGVPVELHPHKKSLTPYQFRLIGGYTGLKDLAVRGATDADVRRLRGLVNLESLDLYDSPITDDACEVIGQFEQLRRLDIVRGSLSETPEITDVGIAALTGLGQLTTLSLHAPNLTDDSLQHIGQLPSLEYLRLTNTQIHGEGLHQLSGLAKLRILALQDCPLEGDCLRQLADGPILFALDLDGSTVNDDMLPALIPIKSLRIVRLDQTEVTQVGCLRLREARPDIDITDAEGKRLAPLNLGNP